MDIAPPDLEAIGKRLKNVAPNRLIALGVTFPEIATLMVDLKVIYQWETRPRPDAELGS